MATRWNLMKQAPESCGKRDRKQRHQQQEEKPHQKVQPEKALRWGAIKRPTRPNQLRVVDEAMEIGKPQPGDEVEHPNAQDQRQRDGRHSHCHPVRRQVERRMYRRSMPRRRTTPGRGIETASKTFRDDRNQAKLQKCSPTEWPEE